MAPASAGHAVNPKAKCGPPILNRLTFSVAYSLELRNVQRVSDMRTYLEKNG